MPTWTWKQAVADEILALVNARRSLAFELDDIYSREEAFQRRFPRNRHVREKIRQTLQRLRDSGFLEFRGKAKYELKIDCPDLEVEPARKGEEGIQLPQRRTVLRNVRLRNTLLAGEMKRRYNNTCQVCRRTVRLISSDCAESHHVKPLGTPHNGPDVEGNIVVVCPNHHVMFDRGAIGIDVDSLVVRHVTGAFRPRPLHLEPWHVLNPQYLAYHSRFIFGNPNLLAKGDQAGA
jgi:hypothetical protein